MYQKDDGSYVVYEVFFALWLRHHWFPWLHHSFLSAWRSHCNATLFFAVFTTSERGMTLCTDHLCCWLPFGNNEVSVFLSSNEQNETIVSKNEKKWRKICNSAKNVVYLRQFHRNARNNDTLTRRKLADNQLPLRYPRKKEKIQWQKISSRNMSWRKIQYVRISYKFNRRGTEWSITWLPFTTQSHQQRN